MAVGPRNKLRVASQTIGARLLTGNSQPATYNPQLFLHEQRKHIESSTLFAHRRIIGRRGETTRCIQYLREKPDVAYRSKEDPGTRENPVYSRINIGLLFERFVPGSPCAFATPPRSTCDRLDRHHRHVPLGANGSHPFERRRVMRILHHDVTVGKQDAIEVEALQTSQMGCSDLCTVAGNADRPNSALLRS